MTRFKLDENLPHEVATTLRLQGVDVMAVAEQKWVGHPDERIILRLRDEGRAMLTLDVRIGDLRRWSPGGHAGVIVFRPPSDGCRAILGFILEHMGYFLQAELAYKVAIVEPRRIRIRTSEPRPRSGDDAGLA